MAYIRFNITRSTDELGNVRYARINRIESSMIPVETLETNIIWNALYRNTGVRMWLKLDVDVLDRDMLGGSDLLTLNRDMLNIDKLA